MKRRSWIGLLLGPLLVVAVIALAQNPFLNPNSDLWIQPDEVISWACDAGTPLSSAAITVTQLRGTTDPDPSTLTGSEGIDTCPGAKTANTCTTWKFTGTGHAGLYQVHVLATATNGDKIACDGKVNVRAVVLPS